MRNRYIIMLAVAIMFVAGSALADITWSQIDTAVTDGDTLTVNQTLYVTPTRFAIVNDMGQKIIVDGTAGTVTVTDSTNASYFASTLQELEDLRKTVRAETEKILEDALIKLPADQREQYRAMLREKMDTAEKELSAVSSPAWEAFSDTGKTGTMLGKKVRCFSATDGGGEYSAWCTTDVETGELDSFFSTVESSTFFQNMQGQQLSLTRIGFPLKYVLKKPGEQFESVVTGIDRNTIPESVFEVPAGYSKQQVPGLNGDN